MLMNDKKVQNFFVNEVVFAYEGLELLSKHKLHKSPKLEVLLRLMKEIIMKLQQNHIRFGRICPNLEVS